MPACSLSKVKFPLLHLQCPTLIVLSLSFSLHLQFLFLVGFDSGDMYVKTDAQFNGGNCYWLMRRASVFLFFWNDH